MKRAWRGALVLVCVLLLAAHGVAWWLIERQLQARLAASLAEWRGEGLAVTMGEPSRGGWPLAATLDIPALAIGPGGVPGGIVLRSDRVIVGLGIGHLDTLRVDLPAPVRLQLPNGSELTADSPDGRIDVKLADPNDVAFDGTRLRARWLAADGGTQEAVAALAHAQAIRTPQGLLTSLSAQSIELPGPRSGQVQPLGRRLASVSGDATVFGTLPGTPDPAAALAAWRDAGGHIAVTRFGVGYGPLGLSGQGDLRLDAGLQPVAQASVRLIGWAQALDALVAAGVVPGRSVAAMKAVLGLLTRPTQAGAQPGAEPEVEVPLTLRDQTVSVAGFPLARTAKLAWPGQP